MGKLELSRAWKYEIPGRSSTAVEALESAWSKLQRIEPDIPPAVLTFVDGRSRSRVKGYFMWSTWKKHRGAAHEIAVNPKLMQVPKHLVATLLHEAAHAILFEGGRNGGMGSTPYYHTTTFRDQCHALGLRCEFANSRYGWTLTGWPKAGVPARYKSIVALLRRTLPAGTRGQISTTVKGRSLPASGHTLLVCGCEGSNRTVYVKKSVLEDGGVMCALCGQEFRRPAS